MTDYLGQTVGNYRLTRVLGEGGFAQVYLGQHVHLDRQAAVKILTTKLGLGEIGRFREEARTIARLTHPQIVQVLDFGVEGRTPYLILQYAAQGTLRQRYPKGTRLPLAQVIAYVGRWPRPSITLMQRG